MSRPGIEPVPFFPRSGHSTYWAIGAGDITQIYPRGIYYYTERGYDSQQVPAVQGFSAGVCWMKKSLSPLFPVGGLVH